MKKSFRKVITTTVAALMTLSNIGLGNTCNIYAQEAERTQLPQEKQLQRKVVGYFPEWAYNRAEQGNFMVTDLQWDYLTHIQYSFGMVDPKTNKIMLGDKKAAIEEDFAGRKILHKGKEIKLDPTLPYKGHFNLLQTMKKQYPNVELLMSVGGWAGTRGFYTMIDTDEGIETFANSCVDFLRQYNFDGIDIDFEYPSATSTCGNPLDQDLAEPRRAKLNERYDKLMDVLREKLDTAANQDGKYYYLTAAVTASSWVLGGMSSHEFTKNLDFLSVMSYDFHGGWNEYVENLANIYPDPADRETASMAMPTLCMDWAYRYYRGALPSEKILMGIPYYTRGWENVTGGTNGLHGNSKTPAGGKYNVWGDDDNNDGVPDTAGANPIWHVKNLLDTDSNLKRYWDDVGKVPYVWQSNEKVFLSYEDEQSIDERVKYIKDKNLGGALIWVMNGDYGLNPNYVAESKDINQGKYTFGDTLTKRLSDGLNKIGPSTKTQDDPVIEPIIDVNVDFTGKYDHPNYQYAITVKNNTDKVIPGGWKLGFDIPKSAKFGSSWSGTANVKDIGDFYRVTITSGGWNSIPVGAIAKIEGTITLSFSDIRNVTFNGSTPKSHVKGPVDPAPLAAKVSADKLQVEIKEAYNITVDIPENSGAIKFVVLENDSSIKEGAVNTAKQSFSVPIMKEKAGDYIYTVKLLNEKGKVTQSNNVKVKVVEALKPLAAKVSVNKENVSIGEEYVIKVDIPENSLAQNYQLLEDDKVITSGTVTNVANTISVPIKKDTKGKYGYQVKLSGIQGTVDSNVINVTVNDSIKPLAATINVDKIEVLVKENYNVNIVIPEKSLATAYELLENGVAIKNDSVTEKGATITVPIVKDIKGIYIYEVKLSGPQGNTISNTIGVTVKEKQVDLPKVPTISATEVKDGKYEVQGNIPSNSGATNYNLYENGKIINSGVVEANAKDETIINEKIVGKDPGSYEYQLELLNVSGKTLSNVVKVIVEKAIPEGTKPGIPQIKQDRWNGEATYNIGFDMYGGENGTQWRLYEDGKLIYTGNLTPNTPAVQSGNYEIKKEKNGSYQYYVELVNKVGISTSNTITVTVTKAASSEATTKPGEPVLSHNNWNNLPNYTITFNMWWGENGTQWKLYENGQQVHVSSLTPNGQSAQTGSVNFTGKAPGKYTYKAELINAAGATPSNEVEIEVK